MNNLSKSIQLSDTQMALSLLNTGTKITSDSYKYFGADYAVNYFLYHWSGEDYTPPSKEDDNTHPDMWRPTLAEEPIEEEIEHFFDDSLQPHKNKTTQLEPDTSTTKLPSATQDTNTNTKHPKKSTETGPMKFGPAPVYTCHIPTGEGNKTEIEMVAVHYPAHWWYHCEQLRHLTVYEYNALISVVPLKDVLEDEDNLEDEACEEESDVDDSGEKDNTAQRRKDGRGRPKRKHFPFHHDHPLSDSHTQCLKDKQPTLIFNSYVPDHPGIPPPPPDPEASPFEISEYNKEN
jgi:hypothetical protein